MLDARRDEEIAASVGAHRDLGGGYDEAIAAGLVERIGAEIDRRVDERVSRYQPAGGEGSHETRHRPAVRPGGQLSWQQTILAFGSMVIGAIASGVSEGHDGGAWPVIAIWTALVVINLAIFRGGRPFGPSRRFPD